MAEPASHQSALVNMLASEQATIASLDDLLEQEQRALADCNPLRLASLSKAKYDLLLQLEKWAPRWQALVTEAGYSPAIGIMAIWIDAQQNSQLSSLWQELKKTTQDVRLKNEINGRLIATQLNYVELQCSTLYGATTPRELYGTDGASYRNSTSRSIAAA